MFLFPAMLFHNSFMKAGIVLLFCIPVLLVELFMLLRIHFFPSFLSEVLTSRFYVDGTMGVILLLTFIYLVGMAVMGLRTRRTGRHRVLIPMSRLFLDMIHFLCLLALALVLTVSCEAFGSHEGGHVVVVDVLMCILLCFALFRVVCGQDIPGLGPIRDTIGKTAEDFVSFVGDIVADPSSEDGSRDIYDRVLAYFEKERPYLNPSMTLQDISMELYTNKSYVSRAITRFSGRNFCQFVNYYRVRHSIELIRKDPTQTVKDLAFRSGFNNPNTFSTAFQIYARMTPRDWMKMCCDKH